MLTLAVYRGDALVEEVALTGQTLRIGRLPENDLILPDEGARKAVSKVHAELRVEKGAYVVHDRGSTNGTWLDGQRITRAALTLGRDVVIGPYRLVLRDDDGLEGDVPSPHTIVEQSHEYDSEPAEIRAGRTPTALPEKGRYAGDALAWLGRQPKPLVFLSAAAVLTLVALIAWQMRPAETPRVAEANVPADVPPASADPPVLPIADTYAPQIEESKVILDRAANYFDTGNFDNAEVQYQSAITKLGAVLDDNPNHAEAVALQESARIGKTQAQDGKRAAKPQESANPRRSTPTANPAAPSEYKPLPQRKDESLEEHGDRNRRFLQELQSGDDLLSAGDCLRARKIFERLNMQEPGNTETPTRLEAAKQDCAKQGQAAIDAGRSKEAGADLVGAGRDYEHAKEYGHPDAESLIAGNIGRKRARAEDLLRRAGEYQTRASRYRDELRKLYQDVIDLELPANDSLRQKAEKGLQRPAGDFAIDIDWFGSAQYSEPHWAA